MVASATAFAPLMVPQTSTKLFSEAEKKVDWNTAAELGWSMGGEDYTRSVQPKEDPDDPRKTIHQGESFEEYMKSRGNAFGQ